MTAEVVKQDHAGEIMERVLLQGDLSRLQASERVFYYRQVCESVGLNPLTKPFEYLQLNGKLTLYATRACTDQLRKMHNVSINIVSREVVDGCYVVTARATMPSNRQDESIGALPIENLKGEARANAMMKGETKAKRRVTLAICGLSFLDESELESVRGAQHVAVAEDGTIAPTPKEIAEAKIAALKAGQPLPQLPEAPLEDTLRESVVQAEGRKRGGRKPNKFQMLQAFGDLKKRYEAVSFLDGYYDILAKYGKKHSNEFEDDEYAKALSCHNELSIDVQNFEADLKKQQEDAGEAQ